MPFPKFEYVEKGKLVIEVEIGSIRIWYGGPVPYIMIAFQVRDCALIARDPGPYKIDKNNLALVPHSRFTTPLNDEEFEKAWNAATDSYLFPERVGQLKQDWPELDKTVPLDILADWLQDHDHDEAAKILREAAAKMKEERGKAEAKANEELWLRQAGLELNG